MHVDDDDFARGLAFYEQRGTIDARRRIRGIVLVAVHRASPVTSPSYDIGLTESELRDRALRALNERAQRDPAV